MGNFHENASNLATYPNRWVAFWLLWGLVLRLTIGAILPAGYDETYYYLYVHYLNLSYFDHPLLVAFTTGFGTWITGFVNPFTIRLGSILLYCGTLYFLYLTGKRIFCERSGLMTLVLATLIPFFTVGFGVLTLPDSPLMFFWSLSLYIASTEFFRSDVYLPSWRILWLSITIGLACLGKYHGFLLGLGLVLFCLFSAKHRRALWSKWTILGIPLFLLVISPLLIWNYQNDWVSFSFQSGRAVPDRGYSILDLLVTFLVSNAYLFPSLGFCLWWVSLRKLWQGFSHKISEQEGLVLGVGVPVFLGFTLMGGYRQILPSWHMPGFFTATLLLGHQVTVWQKLYPKKVRNWLWISGITILLLLTIALFHTSFGIFQKGGKYAIGGGFWDIKQDPSTELVDVVQMRRVFLQDQELQKLLSAADFIFCNNFFLAGQVGMALAPEVKQPITAFDQDIRGFAFWEDDRQWLGKNGLYITSQLFAEDLKKYDGYFAKLTFIKEIPLFRAGQISQTFLLYYAQNLLKTYPRPYGINAID
ncbi:MAG: glycosyltransferase [Cyanobacteria bacterium M5B4]|nr:MAG: glycosyltransferase [Cyanobacteria bacterium M5B4]